MYRVHRATVARWLARGRDRLMRETRAALLSRLRLPGDEIDSILRLIGSRVDISIATALDQASHRSDSPADAERQRSRTSRHRLLGGRRWRRHRRLAMTWNRTA
jgi:hypothetical protein